MGFILWHEMTIGKLKVRDAREGRLIGANNSKTGEGGKVRLATYRKCELRPAIQQQAGNRSFMNWLVSVAGSEWRPVVSHWMVSHLHFHFKLTEGSIGARQFVVNMLTVCDLIGLTQYMSRTDTDWQRFVNDEAKSIVAPVSAIYSKFVLLFVARN